MLTSQLKFLERNNIKEVTIITNENFSKKINDFLLSNEGELNKTIKNTFLILKFDNLIRTKMIKKILLFKNFFIQNFYKKD